MRFTLVDSSNDIPLHTVDFTAPGGTIGRSSDNDLVLPDPDRAISRLQALVHIAAGGECRLTSHGSVIPVLRNGQPLPRNEQVALRHGDVLHIGAYQIAVQDPELASGKPTDDPLNFFSAGEESSSDPLGMFSDPADLPQLAEEPEEPAPLPGPENRPSRPADARLGINPVSHSETPPPLQNEARTAHNDDRHILALLEGMGLDNPQKSLLTEEQMRATGRMLSLFSQGTVALLSSRSILKRGVKAELTMILNEANNPFKILPSGKTVLMQMYQSQMPGFMPPEQAVRDALVDLQAHQLGMIAGIRAIIAAMLQSFNPQRLEEHAHQDGVMPRLALSSQRKAALWDYFSRHYQHTAGELEDDFHTLFGEAFLHAYDMEVHQYKDSQMPENEK